MSENETLEISAEQSLRGILTHQKAILAELEEQTRFLKRINFVAQLYGLILLLFLVGTALSIVLITIGALDIPTLLELF